ncbi:MAG: transcriptional repressor NrdR [Deltaproteobacteria bacterium]|nr:transcriptional repressor NrdR [Deltaproteobacteria bacterium]
MRCPYCASGENGVVDSRETEDGRAIRRRRNCNSCKRRFTTYERSEELQLLVVKKDNSRQSFDRARVLRGMRRACEKRPVSAASLEQSVRRIERAAHDLGEKEVAAHWVGEQVMKALRELDQVAYVRFASVYRSFRDVEEFAVELERMRRQIAERDPQA